MALLWLSALHEEGLDPNLVHTLVSLLLLFSLALTCQPGNDTVECVLTKCKAIPVEVLF